VSADALQGSAWSALYVQGTGATAEPRPYLQWIQATQIAGSGGCNRFVGQAVVTEPEQLQFSSLASTRMACMPEPGGQEDKFFTTLERTRQARLEGDDLILLDTAGTVLAQLRRVDPKAISRP
jgi:putative lipoprotein